MTITRALQCLAGLAALIACSLLTPRAAAGERLEELLRLVPEDAAIGLAVQDLRGHSRLLADSPLLDALRRSPLAQLLPLDAEAGPLAELEQVLQLHLQTSLTELRDDVVGDAMVLAFWPAKGNEGERALFLSRARKAELAGSLMQKFQQAQLQSGDLTRVSPLEERGVRFSRCTERSGKVTFQLAYEGLIALTQNEGTMRQVIQALRDERPNHAVAKSLAELGVLDAFGIFWINPRAFDAEMAAKAAAAEGKEAAFLNTLQTYWRSTRALAAALRIEDDISLNLHVQLARRELPAPAQAFLRSAAEPSSLLPFAPGSAILTLGGRWNPADLLALFLEFAPEVERRHFAKNVGQTTQALLGYDLQSQLLPALGPDCLLYIAPPARERLLGLPDAVLAFRLHPTPELPHPEEAFTESLRTLLGLVALARTNDGKPTALRTERDGAVKIVSLFHTQDAAVGIQPAAAVKQGCLVLALSPEAIRRFGTASSPQATSPSGVVNLGRLSVQQLLAAYLSDKSRRATLVELLSAMQREPRVDVEARLDALQGVLQLVDRVELQQRGSGDQAILTLRIHPSSSVRRTP